MSHGGFMRASGGGPGWSYETQERYSLSFVTKDVPVTGWTAIVVDGEPVAFLKDGPLATALKDFLNRTAIYGAR